MMIPRVNTECIPKNNTHGSHFAVYCSDLVPVGLPILSWINSLALSASEANLHLVPVNNLEEPGYLSTYIKRKSN